VKPTQALLAENTLLLQLRIAVVSLTADRAGGGGGNMLQQGRAFAAVARTRLHISQLLWLAA
jgi:hypothetical protein